MSEIYHRYQRGEFIKSAELNNDAGLRLYGEIIHHEWKQDRATKQLDIEGELHIKKVYPVERPLTPEQEHLVRPADTREGRRQIERATAKQDKPSR